MTAHAAIHVGLKQLGIVEDDARDLYERMTGKRSLREMNPREHEAVASELRRLGAGRKGASKGARKSLQGPFAKKLQALWIAGWNLGIVRDRDDRALLAFVRRQTAIEDTRFLRDAADARRAVEALKGWIAREAKVDWSDASNRPAWQMEPGAKIASAQWEMLVKAGAVDANVDTFRTFVEERSFRPLGQMNAAEWRGVMNTLGERVRAARKAEA